MSRNMQQRIRALGIALLGSFLLLAMAACNDDPQQQTVVVPLDGLQRQMGLNALSSPSDEASTAVLTLLIGPVVVGSGSNRTTAYSTDDLSEQVKQQLEDDVVNSAAYIQLVQLPTSTALLEFTTPPPSAGNWQLAVAAFTERFTTVDGLDEDVVADSVAYYGFTENLLNSGSLPSAPIQINMRRACIIDDPVAKGCAAFNADGTNGADANVTGGVEVWGVYAWDRNSEPDYSGGNRLSSTPLIVRSCGPGTCTSEESALEAAVPAGGTEPGRTLAVVTTHRLSDGYETACGTSTAFNDDLSSTASGPTDALDWLAPGYTPTSEEQALINTCFQIYRTPYN